MHKESTGTKAAKQLELNDARLAADVGGYTREEWVLINKEIEKILHPEGR